MDESLTHLGLVDEETIVLDEAALTIAAVDHPDIDLTSYRQFLEATTSRLRSVASNANSPEEQADALTLIFSGEFGFAGDQNTYDDPANADLIQVIDRRCGLPISLSILYVAAARRLGWSADVLDLPGHVLVLVGEAAAPVIIDPFRRGIAVPAQQLATFLPPSLSRSAASARPIASMSNRAILVRLLLNQATRAVQAGSGHRARDLYGRINQFAPDFGQAWWERARLELAERDVAAAKKSLAAMLEVTREPALRSTITETLAALVAH